MVIITTGTRSNKAQEERAASVVARRIAFEQAQAAEEARRQDLHTAEALERERARQVREDVLREEQEELSAMREQEEARAALAAEEEAAAVQSRAAGLVEAEAMMEAAVVERERIARCEREASWGEAVRQRHHHQTTTTTTTATAEEEEEDGSWFPFQGGGPRTARGGGAALASNSPRLRVHGAGGRGGGGSSKSEFERAFAKEKAVERSSWKGEEREGKEGLPPAAAGGPLGTSSILLPEAVVEASKRHAEAEAARHSATLAAIATLQAEGEAAQAAVEEALLFEEEASQAVAQQEAEREDSRRQANEKAREEAAAAEAAAHENAHRAMEARRDAAAAKAALATEEARREAAAAETRSQLRVRRRGGIEERLKSNSNLLALYGVQPTAVGMAKAAVAKAKAVAEVACSEKGSMKQGRSQRVHRRAEGVSRDPHVVELAASMEAPEVPEDPHVVEVREAASPLVPLVHETPVPPLPEKPEPEPKENLQGGGKEPVPSSSSALLSSWLSASLPPPSYPKERTSYHHSMLLPLLQQRRQHPEEEALDCNATNTLTTTRARHNLEAVHRPASELRLATAGSPLDRIVSLATSPLPGGAYKALHEMRRMIGTLTPRELVHCLHTHILPRLAMGSGDKLGVIRELSGLGPNPTHAGVDAICAAMVAAASRP